MKNFKNAKKYITEKAKELRACSSEYKKALESENFDDLISVIRENAKWTVEKELLTDELSIKYFGVSLLNLLNSGANNTGYRNSGDRNSGYRNSGDRNSGYRNSGYRNSGYRNSGDRNSGDRNSGYRNSGYRNSGYRNSGDWNSGDWNSGDRNSGYRNSGDRNSGYRNSGDWNSGDWNSGFFNSETPEIINVFNTPCKKQDWDNADKPSFIYDLILTEWIWFNDMSEDDKKTHPKAYVCDGYLKQFTYKQAWFKCFQ